MDNISQALQSKLQHLISFLCQVTKGFDTVAEEIDNDDLKTAMIAVAVETKQYAGEICHQLQQLNITISKDGLDGSVWTKIETAMLQPTDKIKGAEIAALCKNCEMYFSKFYTDVLQEYFPYNKLKDIISFQLYAAQCALMKIKLLNSLRFNR
jgi:Domain of unknown function (DUF2383)